MKLACLLGAVVVAFVGPNVRWAAGQEVSPVSFEKHDDRLSIRVSGKPFADYVFRDAKIRRPYLANVRVHDGRQVTRNHPPAAGDAVDHDTMHPGIWLAFGSLAGHDFWRNKSVVEQVAWIAEPKGDATGGEFIVENRYLADGQTVCDERCRLRIEPRSGGALVIWDSSFSGPRDFTFGDQEEMGLGVRVASSMTVKNGGRLINSEGRMNEKQVWGRQADWCDFSQGADGRRAGILLVPDPRNFGRSWFHSRDYGLLVANPFGRASFKQGETQQTTVKAGETFRLRFAVLVYNAVLDLPAAAQASLDTMSQR